MGPSHRQSNAKPLPARAISPTESNRTPASGNISPLLSARTRANIYNRHRPTSVEKDMADLTAMREEIRRVNVNRDTFFKAEHKARLAISRQFDKMIKETKKQWAWDMINISKRDENRHRRAVEQKLHERIGELLQKSREQATKQREADLAQRTEEKRAAVKQYREKVKSETKQRVVAARDARREMLVSIEMEKEDRKRRLGRSHEALHARRAKTVMEERELEEDHRMQRMAESAVHRANNRQRAKAQRRSVFSPAKFLELPPLKEILHDEDATTLTKIVQDKVRRKSRAPSFMNNGSVMPERRASKYPRALESLPMPVGVEDGENQHSVAVGGDDPIEYSGVFLRDALNRSAIEELDQLTSPLSQMSQMSNSSFSTREKRVSIIAPTMFRSTSMFAAHGNN